MAITTAKKIFTEPRAVNVRFESTLLQQVKDAARHSFRSVNAEINSRLRDSFESKADEASV